MKTPAFIRTRSRVYHQETHRAPEMRTSNTVACAAAAAADYGGPVARRRRAEDGEAEQTRSRARRGREQDFAEISRRMHEEIRSSRDPRDHVEDG